MSFTKIFKLEKQLDAKLNALNVETEPEPLGFINGKPVSCSALVKHLIKVSREIGREKDGRNKP